MAEVRDDSMVSEQTLTIMSTDQDPTNDSTAVKPELHSWKPRGSGLSGKRLSSCSESNVEQPQQKKRRAEVVQEVTEIEASDAAEESAASKARRLMKQTGFSKGDAPALLREFYENAGTITRVKGDGDCYLHAPLAALNMCEHAEGNGKRLRNVTKRDEIGCEALLTLVQVATTDKENQHLGSLLLVAVTRCLLLFCRSIANHSNHVA